jgi:hypothetical protein
MHQAAGGIVDIDEQRALRPAILEPPVLGTIDLHKLTQAIAPSAGLMNTLETVFPPNPNIGGDHPLSQCLNAEIQAVKNSDKGPRSRSRMHSINYPT